MAIQAVILAGGLGTRLRPLTLDRPKPVVPLLNVPFLYYQLGLLGAHGVRDVILSVSHRPEAIRATMDRERLGEVRLREVVEQDPLGTAGGVRNAADLVEGRVVVLNGDILTDLDLSAMLAVHESSGAAGDHLPHARREPHGLWPRRARGGRPRPELPGEAGLGRGHDEHHQRRRLRPRARAPRAHPEGRAPLDRARVLPAAPGARRAVPGLRLDGLLDRHRNAGEVPPGAAGSPGAPDPGPRRAGRARESPGMGRSHGDGGLLGEDPGARGDRRRLSRGGGRRGGAGRRPRPRLPDRGGGPASRRPCCGRRSRSGPRPASPGA